MNASNAVDMGTRRETAKRGVPLDLPTQGEVMILTTLATEDPEEIDTETETTEKAAEEVAREDTTDEVLAEATVGAEDEMIEVILQPVTTGGGIEKKSKELHGHYLSQDPSQGTDSEIDQDLDQEVLTVHLHAAHTNLETRIQEVLKGLTSFKAVA